MEPMSPASSRIRLIPWSGRATIGISAVIVVGVFVLAAADRLVLLQGATSPWTPFAAALIGVSLYVMASVRKRRDRFDAKFLPDYAFRAAQAIVYVYVILAIGVQSDKVTNLSAWPPNVIGLFVGMFILHVEKAMEGLGQRFEEVLTGLLPRSLAAQTSREKQTAQLSAEMKFRDIQKQSELLASQMRSSSLYSALQTRLKEVEGTIRDGDPDAIQDAVSALAGVFERIKVDQRVEARTVEEVLNLDDKSRT
jgi:hypothetical protein